MHVITGCPRSGTSFVCQLAKQMGANFGDDSELLVGNHWNRNGYFENRVINTINHRLMFGKWSNPKWWIDTIWEDNFWSYARKTGSLLCSPWACQNRLIMERASQRFQEIRQTAAKFTGITIKDPRFCHTLPAWQSATKIENVLFVIRHPWEVANSLTRQTGYPICLTLRAWHSTVCRFLDNVDTNEITFIDFNGLQSECQKEELEILRDFVGFKQLAQSVDIESVFDQSLRTSKHENARLPGFVKRCYRRLLNLKKQY